MIRWVGALTATLVLTACADGPDVARTGFGLGFGDNAKAPAKVTVTQDAIDIRGPRGFCVDSQATRDGENGAFVLLGSCASISGNLRSPAPATPALLTASVSQPSVTEISQATDALAAFFTSAEGRAALSRDGQPGSVRIVDTSSQNGLFILHAQHSGTDPQAGLGTDQWRGLFNLSGRIVTVSVVGFAADPLDASDGRKTLTQFAARIRADNQAGVPVAGAASPGGFLQRLLK